MAACGQQLFSRTQINTPQDLIWVLSMKRWTSSGQNWWDLEVPKSHGRPAELSRKPLICPSLRFSGRETRIRQKRPALGPTARQWLVQHQGGQVLLSNVSFSHGMGCSDI